MGGWSKSQQTHRQIRRTKKQLRGEKENQKRLRNIEKKVVER